MNHSLYTADRATHSKIVAAALAIGMVIAGLATVARVNSTVDAAGAVAVTKTGKPVTLTSTYAAAIVR